MEFTQWTCFIFMNMHNININNRNNRNRNYARLLRIPPQQTSHMLYNADPPTTPAV